MAGRYLKTQPRRMGDCRPISKLDILRSMRSKSDKLQPSLVALISQEVYSFDNTRSVNDWVFTVSRVSLPSVIESTIAVAFENAVAALAVSCTPDRTLWQ